MGSDSDGPATDSDASGWRFDAHGHQHTHKHSAHRPDDRSGQTRRVEVIIGGERRRRWPAQEKARITAESFEPGASVSDVARRNGVSLGLLHYWRRRVRAFGQSEALEFIPVKSAEEAPDVGARALSSGCIEIEVDGARIRVSGSVDGNALRTVLAAVRASM